MSSWDDEFFDALRPLTWGYSDGDDGDLIKIALEELTSILQKLPVFRELDVADLPDLLREARVGEDDVDRVERLQELATKAGYGGGLNEEQAEEVDTLANELAGFLEEFVKEHRRRRGPRRRASAGVPEAASESTLGRTRKVGAKRRARRKGDAN